MSRRFTALKPQLNRIRAWAQEGSTDAWIAHQLDTTADAIRGFRQENGIERGGPAPLAPITPDSVVEAMLAEEEAAAAAQSPDEAPAPAPDTAPAPEPLAEGAPAPARAPRRRTRKRTAEPVPDGNAEAPAADATPAADETAGVAGTPAKRSRRGTRGGSGRSGSAVAETTEAPPPAVEDDSEADGDEDQSRVGTTRKRGGRRRGRGRGAARALEARLLPGSVLLLDPAVTADPAFQEHWGDAGPLRVEIGADTIVLRRASPDAEAERQPAS